MQSGTSASGPNLAQPNKGIARSARAIPRSGDADPGSEISDTEIAGPGVHLPETNAIKPRRTCERMGKGDPDLTESSANVEEPSLTELLANIGLPGVVKSGTSSVRPKQHTPSTGTARPKRPTLWGKGKESGCTESRTGERKPNRAALEISAVKSDQTDPRENVIASRWARSGTGAELPGLAKLCGDVKEPTNTQSSTNDIRPGRDLPKAGNAEAGQV